MFKVFSVRCCCLLVSLLRSFYDNVYNKQFVWYVYIKSSEAKLFIFVMLVSINSLVGEAKPNFLKASALFDRFARFHQSPFAPSAKGLRSRQRRLAPSRLSRSISSLRAKGAKGAKRSRVYNAGQRAVLGQRPSLRSLAPKARVYKIFNFSLMIF